MIFSQFQLIPSYRNYQNNEVLDLKNTLNLFQEYLKNTHTSIIELKSFLGDSTSFDSRLFKYNSSSLYNTLAKEKYNTEDYKYVVEKINEEIDTQLLYANYTSFFQYKDTPNSFSDGSNFNIGIRENNSLEYVKCLTTSKLRNLDDVNITEGYLYFDKTSTEVRTCDLSYQQSFNFVVMTATSTLLEGPSLDNIFYLLDLGTKTSAAVEIQLGTTYHNAQFGFAAVSGSDPEQVKTLESTAVGIFPTNKPYNLDLHFSYTFKYDTNIGKHVITDSYYTE